MSLMQSGNCYLYNTKMKKLLSIILLISAFIPKLSQSALTDNIGTTGGTFLKIPIGSRMVAMGEAFTAVADDPLALMGNMAGIARNRDLEISFSHVEWFGDVDYEYIAFTRSFFKGIKGMDSSMGASLNYLHLPFFQSYDDWGVAERTVRVSDYAFTVAYAQNLGPLNAGMAVRYINEVSDGAPDGALTYNFGLLLSTRLPDFNLFGMQFIARPLDFGFLMENWDLGTDIGGYNTPVLYKFGMAFKPFDQFIYSLDVHVPLDNRARLNMGCEYGYNDTIFFRFGYRFFGYEIDSYTMGIGGKFKMSGKYIKLDLSFAPASIVGNTLNFSLSMKYPGTVSDEERKLANILYYKGIYFYTRGELDQAIEIWEETLRLYPDFELAKEKIIDAKKLRELRLIEETVQEKLQNGEPSFE